MISSKNVLVKQRLQIRFFKQLSAILWPLKPLNVRVKDGAAEVLTGTGDGAVTLPAMKVFTLFSFFLSFVGCIRWWMKQ